MKIQIVISYVFACNKNKPLQLQRVPILSILGYNIGSLAASGSTLLVLRQFCVGKGGKFDHRPERPNVLLRHLANPEHWSTDRPNFGFGFGYGVSAETTWFRPGFGYGKKERSNYGFGRNLTTCRPKPAVTGSTA